MSIKKLTEFLIETKNANYEVVHTDGDYEVRKTKGSLGHQLYHKGKFHTFQPKLEQAKAMIKAMKDKEK